MINRGTNLEKLDKLNKKIKALVKEGLVLAFSGGVDSSLLMTIASKYKEEGRLLAVTFSSQLNPIKDLEISKKLAEEYGVDHYVLEINEFSNSKIMANPPDRCYHCKDFLFQSLRDFAEEKGIKNIADGTNIDDTKVYRPGLKALGEHGVISPLKELEIDKQTVRIFAKKLGLEVHNRPSAPCLATRIPYGTELKLDILRKIDEGENFLKELGFENIRLRLHEDIVRLEVNEDQMPEIIRLKTRIIEKMKDLGFTYICLDLEGFRSGSMDVKINFV